MSISSQRLSEQNILPLKTKKPNQTYKEKLQDHFNLNKCLLSLCNLKFNKKLQLKIKLNF